MWAEVIATIGSLILLCVSFVTEPTHATCGDRWYVDRVSAAGFYACRRTMNGDLPESMRPAGVRFGWIYCTNGTRAVTNVDGVTVGCARRSEDSW